MDLNSKIYIAGHRGMVGSAIIRNLKQKGYTNLIVRTSAELDLRNSQNVNDFFATEKPDYVFLAAAKVGGIQANNLYRADFIYENLMIQNNVIHNSYLSGVKKLMFLGSSCIYPKLAPQPLKEESLLTGLLEETNEPYAIAKIAGIKMCESYKRQYGCNFISVMPTNMYGPNDNYNLNNSHVLPALIRRFHEAKESNDPYVECWGDGSAMREFLYVDDLAEACYICMQNYNSPDIINIGTGEDLTIKSLTEKIVDIIGYTGEVRWDTSKPNGTPKKVLNIDKIKALGWDPKISLNEGIFKTYEFYKQNGKNT